MRIYIRNFLLIFILSGLATVLAAEAAERPSDEARPEPNRSAPGRDPFAPSDRMRQIEAQPNANDYRGGYSSGVLPTLECLIANDKTALASFRYGEAWAMVERGDAFTLGGVKYVFDSCDNDTVIIKDSSGRAHEIRPGSLK